MHRKFLHSALPNPRVPVRCALHPALRYRSVYFSLLTSAQTMPHDPRRKISLSEMNFSEPLPHYAVRTGNGSLPFLHALISIHVYFPLLLHLIHILFQLIYHAAKAVLTVHQLLCTLFCQTGHPLIIIFIRCKMQNCLCHFAIICHPK